MAGNKHRTELSDALTDSQRSALFDILSHYETYAEIESFKDPKTIQNYGVPFQSSSSTQPATPILQHLFTRLGLPLPGLKAVNQAFWPDRILPLVSSLSSANLSESYDKGVLGQRKTLSTATSVLLEYLGRGYFGGLEKRPLEKEDGKYDLNSPLDSVAAWEDLVQMSVYGDAIDSLFADAARTDKLSEHPLRVQAAHRYIVLNLASILHFIFVVSPKGPSILGLLESVHKLIPYAIVRSTLRIGNAASMISAMVKVVLAKASVGAVTNWLGVSAGANEGMNLLQIIISTALNWDISSLKKRITSIEKNKEVPNKDHLGKLREYVEMSPEEQEKRRSESKSQSKSLASVVLSDSTDLSDSAHSLAVDYLSVQLSIADRQRLIGILCRQNPDILTPVMRDLVTAYEPVIRAIHNAVDLSGTVYDAQNFLDDFIKLSKKASTEPPSVSDYVMLLEKHQGSSHRFLHQVSKNGKDISEEYQNFVYHVVSMFRREDANDKGSDDMGASLNKLVEELSVDDRRVLTNELDLHAAYRSILHQSSSQRIEVVLSEGDQQSFGPGAYIERWQSLLDETEITPSKPKGKIRKGADLDVKRSARVDVAGEVKGDEVKELQVEDEMPKPPDVSHTRKLLGKKFLELLRHWKKGEKV